MAAGGVLEGGGERARSQAGFRMVSLVDERELSGLAAQSRIMDAKMFLTLLCALPPRLQFRKFNLLYSTAEHGISLQTLYNRAKTGGSAPCLLAVKDTQGNVFGALTSEAWRLHSRYYGSGESFLFSFFPTFAVHEWTGANSYFMMGKEDAIAVGGGKGTFGLWLDADFLRGSSGPCETYGNQEGLTGQPQFECVHVEVWALRVAGSDR